MTAAKPERVPLVIIGGGASGATTAKLLTEAGHDVLVLERGPWMGFDEFSGDELANVNRNYLTPDPDLHPRTFRPSDQDVAVTQEFSPTPFMVGGGTTHWAGWVPRMLESDFRQRSIHGDVEGASLVDWPLPYSEFEPYYVKVEQALGVSGLAGANKYESTRSAPYPNPPLPSTRYGRRFRLGCERLGWNSFPMPIAQLSQPYDGRGATVQNAFVHLHGDPTGTRSGVLSTFIPDAVRTGRVEIRTGCYVRSLETDATGRITSAVYLDDDGVEYEQEADFFVLACNAIESARLLLLSSSPAHPDGLANSSGLVGRNLTTHEYTEALGLFDDELLYPWAGGGFIGECSYEFYEADKSQPFIGGGLIAAGSAGIPLPVNWNLPGRPRWGDGMVEFDREHYNRGMSAGVILSDLPQASNRVDLDPDVTDDWGLPVARITMAPHPNDIAQVNHLVDRAADILRAAGATKVWTNHIHELTGNSRHQHGTLRMGDDPATSVVDRWGRAHDVPNLLVVDGSVFPTPGGVNPTLTIMANAWRMTERLIDTRGA